MMMFLIVTSIVLCKAESSTDTLSGFKEKYIKQEIFLGKWGTKQREFGLRIEKHQNWHITNGVGSYDVLPISYEEIEKIPKEELGKTIFIYMWGPRGIDVDKDENIYILDCINKRIMKYNSEGNFITSIDYEFKDWSANLLYIDSQGDIYVGGRRYGGIRRLTPEGKLLEKLSIKEEIYLGIYQKAGNIYSLSSSENVPVATLKKGIDKKKQSNDLRKEKLLKIIKTKKLIKKSKDSLFSDAHFDLSSLSSDNKQGGTIIVEGVYHKQIPLGVNKNNHLFIFCERGKRENSHGEIREYDVDGKLINVVNLKSLSESWTTEKFSTNLRHVAISDEGNIYQVFTKKEGVYVVKWQSK